MTDGGLGTRQLPWNVADLMVRTNCVQDLHKTNFTAENKKVILAKTGIEEDRLVLPVGVGSEFLFLPARVPSSIVAILRLVKTL